MEEVGTLSFSRKIKYASMAWANFPGRITGSKRKKIKWQTTLTSEDG